MDRNTVERAWSRHSERFVNGTPKPKGDGWQRTRKFTLGAALYEHDLPDDKRLHVEEWLTDLPRRIIKGLE